MLFSQIGDFINQMIEDNQDPCVFVSNDLLNLIRVTAKVAVESEVNTITGHSFIETYIKDEDYSAMEGMLVEPSNMRLSTILEEGNNPLSKGLSRRQKSIDAVLEFHKDPSKIKNAKRNHVNICRQAANILAALSGQESMIGSINKTAELAREDDNLIEIVKECHDQYLRYLHEVSKGLTHLGKFCETQNVKDNIAYLKKNLEIEIEKSTRVDIADLIRRPSSKMELR